MGDVWASCFACTNPVCDAQNPMRSQVYFLPITEDIVTQVIEKERPDSILLQFGMSYPHAHHIDGWRCSEWWWCVPVSVCAMRAP